MSVLGSRFWALIASLGLVATALLLAAPAQAGTEQCFNGAACVWKDNTYSGRWRGMVNNMNDYYTVIWSDHVPYGNNYINQDVSSVRNQGVSCDVRFHEGADGSGGHIYSKRVVDGVNYQDPYLTNGGGTGTASSQNWDNRIRSHRFTFCR